MHAFVVMFGVVFLTALVGVIVCIVGLPLYLLVAIAAAGLGHPLRNRSASRTPSHTRSPIPVALRRAVLERDGWACVECGAIDDLEMDHEVPVSRGGATSYENLRVLCHDCNHKKGAY